MYKRVLLKLSGESLLENQDFGVELTACTLIAESIKEVVDAGVQVGVVIGGGNIFRGNQAKSFGFKRTPADHIGMLATAINGLVLQQALSSLGCNCRVMSALPCGSLIDAYSWPKAMHALDKGEVIIFAGGTGNPYFTTDTAAALRASELDAEILLKATKVDGIYDKDPMKYPDAKKYEHLTYTEVLAEDLKVMDATAVALCRENQIPIFVFDLFKKGALLKAVQKNEGGTLVNEGKE